MPPRSPRVPLPHYHGLWRRMALFSRLKLKVQFALSKKVIIPRRRGRVADLLSREEKGEEERYGLLEACNDLPKWIVRWTVGVDGFWHVEFEVRGVFLETGNIFKKEFFNDNYLMDWKISWKCENEIYYRNMYISFEGILFYFLFPSFIIV